MATPKKTATKSTPTRKTTAQKPAPKKVSPSSAGKAGGKSVATHSTAVAGEEARAKGDPAPLRKVGKEALTSEEKARAKKLRETMAILKADAEWPAFLEEQKEMLLQLRDEIAPNVQNVTRDHLRSGDSNLSSSSGQHIGDAGSDAEVRDLTIRLLDKDREQLFEIDAALERIRRGTYGICEISLDVIPKGRLKVRPFCRLTVKCQEEYEKKYGSYAGYRAKKSDNVGYAGLQNDMENAILLDDSEE